jgi:alkanesulfonate monooxygenase SsuD/methylene tetrahydromethanopterin reductase-like flavin-dependent oxidoreductase (luciferase family)
MRFAFSLLPISHGPEHDEWMVEAEIRLGLLADNIGFDLVMTGERHFSGIGGGNPLLALAALVPQLKNAWVGTGVIVVPNYHPIRLAEMLNIIDHHAKGKAIFGLGSGMAPEDAVAFGFEIAKQSDEMFHEGVEALLKVWAKQPNDPPLTIESGHYKGTLLERITPTPYRKAHPYLKTTAATPRHVDRAVREGWPIFFIKRDAADARPLFEQYRRGLLSYGHSQEVLAHCAEWTSIAKPAMHIAETDAQAAEEWHYLDARVAALLQRKVRYGNEAKEMQGIIGPLSNVQDRGPGTEFRKHMTVHGGVETITAHVREIEELGMGMFHLSLIGPVDEKSYAVVERSVRLFADQVIPHFKRPIRPYSEQVIDGPTQNGEPGGRSVTG